MTARCIYCDCEMDSDSEEWGAVDADDMGPAEEQQGICIFCAIEALPPMEVADG